ncbi:hypothetical protein [Aureimonas sp. Leaf324]|uniref:hypothetical protein n=1 Tax=Aureimonas sp. Leaf324 TaxID=1736336 RepID=UPI0012E1444F|nr:hypothetical protein [Aureimonas sp. Leaf324]
MTIALAVVVALLCVSIGPSVYHDPDKGSHSTAALDNAVHPRDLDDGPTEKTTKVANGLHAHNSGDHGHEKLGIPPEFPPLIAHAGRSVHASAADNPRPSLSTTLDRPPRPTEIA